MKAPFRVLYSNDTTNLCTCRSPFQPAPNWVRDEGSSEWVYRELNFSRETLEAGLDETAGCGVEVHLLQPGVGWVPWWRSRVYPFSEHVRFMKERTGMDPSANAYAAYMAAGGDMVDVFVRRCRRNGQVPFISFRLNDSHGHEFVAMAPKDIQSWAWHVFCPIHANHPEWRIGKDLSDWNGRVLNWAIPEVRRFKFAFIEELCEQYDIEGFELDFMRHHRFFDERLTSAAERREIMTGFVRDVRQLLDRTARTGQKRWLCVRVPACLELHDDLGIDLRAFAAAGVEMVNLSHSYFTRQSGDLEAIRALVPDLSLYLEMCHCTAIARPRTRFGYDSFLFRRTTPWQFWTTAHQAYARGADGLSTFNFVYYREHGPGPRGPFHEPPFAMHRHLGDPDWLGQQPQHYVIGSTWLNWGPPERRIESPEGPWRKVQPGAAARFELDLAPPSGGWRHGGRFRIQAPVSFDVTEWHATFNGQRLQPTDDRSEPYGMDYPNLLGSNEQLRAWVVPTRVLRSGLNTVAVTLAAGDVPMEICFADLAVE